jgi:hypothetical protein
VILLTVGADLLEVSSFTLKMGKSIDVGRLRLNLKGSLVCLILTTYISVCPQAC